jgi:hypothetical protein
VGHHDHITDGGGWDITTISLKLDGWDITTISLKVGVGYHNHVITEGERVGYHVHITEGGRVGYFWQGCESSRFISGTLF